MRALLIATSILGIAVCCTPALAQQKTVKACQEEWRANKADNQAKGITEKAYVAQCRGGSTAAAPAPTTTAAPATPVVAPTTAAAPAAGGQKTVKACRDEWRANKADNQAKGITEKAFVEQCRGGSTAAAPASATPAPAPAPTASTPAPTPTPSAPATAAKPAPRTTTTGSAPSGANQFTSEAQAKGRCPTDTVLWINLNSDIYHFTGHKDYGNTKSGAYMCEKDATGAGMRAAKNEKRP